MRPSGSTVADLQHALVAHEVVLLLETDGDSGLPTHEARERLARFGPNELPPPVVAGPLVRLARQVHHPLVYVLLVAGAITLILGNVVDAGVIFGVVVVNAVVGFIQEPKAEVALDALRSLVQTEARVRRDGHLQTIPSAELSAGTSCLSRRATRSLPTFGSWRSPSCGWTSRP